MRTTIRLDDALLRRAKAAAAARGTSLNDLIEDAVRAALAPRPTALRVAERPRPVIPTFKGAGTHAGVDLDDSSALADLMDDLRVIVTDVNVLVYAFREDAQRHTEYRDWLAIRAADYEPFGVSELVLSGVLRILTHPRIFLPATPLDKALAFIDAVRGQPNCVLLQPGPRHWEIFIRLCTQANAKGNLIGDAYHAALAIEHGCEWITTDRDFARFKGLRWRHPLD